MILSLFMISRGCEAPTMKNVLLGKKISASMFMERIPIDTIPTDEKLASQWLHDLYKKKDAMLDSFLETGDWFKTSGEKRVEGFPMPRRIYPLLNTIAWSFIVLLPVGRYLISLLLSGDISAICIGIFIIASCKSNKLS